MSMPRPCNNIIIRYSPRLTRSRNTYAVSSDTLQTNLSPLTLLLRNSSNAFCALSTMFLPSISLYLFG